MAERKQFDPTERRLREARKEGNVQKSQLLTQAVLLLLTTTLLWGTARFTWVEIEMLLKLVDSNGLFESPGYLKSLGKVLIGGTVGAASLLALGAIVAEIVQVGLQFELGVVAPKGSRLDLVQGLQRMGTGIGTCWEVLLKGVIFITVCGWFLRRSVEEGVSLLVGGGEPLSWCMSTGLRFLWLGAGLFVLFGVGDYALRRFRYRRDLSMSLDEVRREHKEQEGDPFLRAVRKGMHEALLLQDLERRVRRSKVVVVETADRRV